MNFTWINYKLHLQKKEPALWLLKNDARTPLFMLEGLTRVYEKLHNKKRFTKLKEKFKLLEDSLGAIEYYDAFIIECGKNKNITPGILNYLEAQKKEKSERLDEILLQKKWFGNKLKKIRTKLSNADWRDEKDEIEAVNDFYGEAIYEIVEFVHQPDFPADDIEAGLHELRRNLRWLSIYAHALRGCIQLKKSKTTVKHLTKYLTKQVIQSPFNKFPPAGNCKKILFFNEKYFLSLSWIIEELGKIKDSTLKVIMLKEALQSNAALTDKNAFDKAYQLLGSKQIKISTLLKKAEGIYKLYFKEHNLEHLIYGISNTK